MPEHGCRPPAAAPRRRFGLVSGALLLASGLALSACSESTAPSTVVLVVVDTLRADRLGVYGYQRDTTPHLDQWAERGAVFERCYATSSWTLPSVGSILTGRYPYGHGAGWKDPQSGVATRFPALFPQVPTVASILSAAGWSTSAAVTNSFLRQRFGLAKGFDEYDFASTRFAGERNARWVVDRVLAKLDARSGPTLLLAHFMDPHVPYDPQGAFRGRYTASYHGPLELPFDRITEYQAGELTLTPPDQRFLADAYDEQLGYLDEQLDRLLRRLDEEGILDRGLVLLLSDHGEELFDHGGFEHGHSMFDEVLRVPLIVWGRGVRRGRIETPVSLVDIAPTIVEGVRLVSPVPLDGVSLWPLLADRQSSTSRPLGAQINLYGRDLEAVVVWPYKAIFDRATGRAELYRLDRDPHETHDLAAAEPARVDRLRSLLRQTVSEEPAAALEHVVIDPDLAAELEALGYVTGTSEDSDDD